VLFSATNLWVFPCRYLQSVVLPIGKVTSLSNCIANEKFVGAIGIHLEGQNQGVPINRLQSCKHAMSQNYLISSGEKNRGKNSTMSGNTMMASSTTSIGISMIMVSLMAKLIGTLATAHDIMRHMP